MRTHFFLTSALSLIVRLAASTPYEVKGVNFGASAQQPQTTAVLSFLENLGKENDVYFTIEEASSPGQASPYLK